MNIVVFGANGPTGRLLIRHALDAGHPALAVTRQPETFPVTDPRLNVARADVYHQNELPVTVDGADAVPHFGGWSWSVRPAPITIRIGATPHCH